MRSATGCSGARPGVGPRRRQPRRRHVRSRDASRSRSIRALFVPWAIGAAGAAVAPSIWVAAVAMVVCGFGNGLTFPLTVVIVQQGAPDRIRGRVFTVIISVHNAILGVAFALGGGADERLRRALGVRRRGGADRSAAASRPSSSATAYRSGRRPRAARVASALVARRREWTRETLVEAVRGGDPRALARAITLVENGDPLAYELVQRRLPAHGPRARGRHHRAARRRQVDARLRADPPRARARSRQRRRHLGRPVEPVHAGRAARRPHPAQRPLPRPGRLHPLDGHARAPRRPRRDDAADAARARRRRQGRRASSRRSAPARARSGCSRSPTPSCSR